jgi:hypothetical protein
MRQFGWLIVGFFLVANVNDLFGQGRLASRFGEATVSGQRVIVHVTVAIPTGLDENAVAEDAVRAQGARPLQPAEFTVTGIKWDQFSNFGSGQVLQHYNSAGDPASAAASLINAQNTWTNVGTSNFVFSYAGITSRCPSLVKECPGPQTFDTFNDVGWVALSGCCDAGRDVVRHNDR